MDIKIRQIRDSDKRFVLNSFLNTVRLAGTNKYMRTSYFFDTFGKRLQDIVEKCNIWIACHPDEGKDDFIYGYICILDGRVVMAYTRLSVRKMGVFKSLFEKTIGKWKTSHKCTFINTVYKSIFDKNVEYEPS